MKRIIIFISLKVVEIVGGILMIIFIPFNIGLAVYKLGYGMFSGILGHINGISVPFPMKLWIDGSFYLLCFGTIIFGMYYCLYPLIYKCIQINWKWAKKLAEK
jgi:hypothetical protein